MTDNPWFQRLYRPPWVGLLALVIVFLALPLSHSVTVLVNYTVGREASHLFLLPLGLASVGLLVWGIRRDDEVSGTLIGFLTGYLMWTAWASYAFRFNEISLGLPMPELGDGMRWPMNLLFIQGSVGICVVTLLYFVFDRETKCNAFMWLQRRLHLNLGSSGPSRGRNVCRVTFMETVYVIWFCYAISLFMSDVRFLGYYHPGTFAILAALSVWGLYLVWRLMRFTRLMAGIRYAIPAKALFWIPFGEFFPRYGFYEEIWLKPWEYRWAMLGVLVVFAGLFLISPWLPQRRMSTRDGRDPGDKARDAS
jgi:hypothetical protein